MPRQAKACPPRAAQLAARFFVHRLLHSVNCPVRLNSLSVGTHLDPAGDWNENGAMSESAIQGWLLEKQRQALLSARLYFAATASVGTLALLVDFGIAFLVVRLPLLLLAPRLPGLDLWAGLLAMPLIALLFRDCVRADRDDMSIIPLWLAREYFHAGPRLILEGWHELARARRFARTDTEFCSEVLEYLAKKATPTSSEEFNRVFPMLAWERIASQLRWVDGVILFRGAKSISLMAPLRMELRQLLAGAFGAEIHEEEAETVPVNDPAHLTSHEILGVSATASAAEIKAAYRNRVKECHPDRFANLDAKSRQLAEEWTKALNAAYADLMGERSR